MDQSYYHGGAGLDHRRAHVICVERLRLEIQKTQDARRALAKGT